MQVASGSHHSAEVKGKDKFCKAEYKSCDLIIQEEIVFSLHSYQKLVTLQRSYGPQLAKHHIKRKTMKTAPLSSFCLWGAFPRYIESQLISGPSDGPCP